MRISVALCTHDGAGFVEQQVRSILTQDPRPDELVLGDDASRDDTVAIVERLAGEHPGTTLVVRRHDPPLGVAANFADATAHATGDIVVLSDQDDVWLPGKLAALRDAFAADPEVLLVHSDARLVGADGLPLGRNLLDALEASPAERSGLAGGGGFEVLLRRNLVTGMTAAIRRELADFAFPVGEGWIHDEWLAAIAAATGRIRLLPVALADYRQHGGNQIGARRLTRREQLARLREPREPRASRQLERAESYVAALERLGERVPADRLAAARARVAHRRRRRDLPQNRIARAPRVLFRAALGEYSRFSYGLRDVLRDLLQPPSQAGLR
ncbi:MAG TPA: glycosyltransferase family 2 protein [Pseudolysinimonas sp.]|nr:glycosyltransferase family 2 protein [Pseudolysinimonas sp.]